jgi:hypothetical protein
LYRSCTEKSNRHLDSRNLENAFGQLIKELLHLSRSSSSDHHVKLSTYPQPSPHGSTLSK